MNFFDQQEKLKRKTAILVFYFILAILLIILAFDAVIVWGILGTNDPNLISSFGGTPDYTYGGSQNTWPLFLNVGLMIAPIIIAIILLGSFFRMRSLKAGGIAVAEMAGATPIDPNTQDRLEKRFLNVVEEMSIASGVPVPKLYIMKKEQGINAFVAGLKPEDTVMVVTQGALEQLNRDELQGVVGHEYSHVLNTDMQLSVRLIGIIAGLLLISQLGYYILNMTRFRSASNEEQRSVPLMIVAGMGLYILGYIGLFFGSLIKASISRKRELLADASSVQFTRDPSGLINALKRIEESTQGTLLRTKHAQDISHLCFCPSIMSIFATHPPIEERIKALSEGSLPASFEDKQKTIQPEAPKNTGINPQTFGMGAILAGGILRTSKKQVEKSIGNPSQQNIDLAQHLLSLIPNSIKEIAHQPENVEMLYYALLLPKDDEKTSYRIILKDRLNQEKIDQVSAISQQLEQLPPTTILPLLDLSLLSFKMNPLEKRRSIFQTLQKIVSLDKSQLFQFTLLAMIGKVVEVKPIALNKHQFDNFTAVLPELSTLIAFVIKSGHREANENENIYNKIMLKYFPYNKIPLPPVTNFDPVVFQKILEKLNLLSPSCKEKLIQSCLECIEEDNVILIDEAEIVRAIASCLDCPIPPIVPNQ